MVVVQTILHLPIFDQTKRLKSKLPLTFKGLVINQIIHLQVTTVFASHQTILVEIAIRKLRDMFVVLVKSTTNFQIKMVDLQCLLWRKQVDQRD